MAQAAIGVIEPLKWSKTSTSIDFDKWLKIFECSLVINGIVLATNGHPAKEKAMLYV